ncbi:hypothetical protein BH09PSE2_BH09PSE2_22870 [soil metagenome]
MGFSITALSVLEAALVLHPDDAFAIVSEPTPYGVKFVVEGPLETPNGRRVLLRTVWFTHGDGVRLVTAYPG